MCPALVSPNLFSFRAGESITITGRIELKLVVRPFGRTLLATSSTKKLNDEKSLHEITRYLAREMLFDAEVITNSASLVKNIGNYGNVFLLLHFECDGIVVK